MESFTNAPDASKRRLEFAYDWRSRRLNKKVSTLVGSNYVAQSTNKFLYDDWNMIADLNTTNGVVCSYVWGLDLSGTMQGVGGVAGLLTVNSSTGGVHFLSYDGNGNVSALVNATNGALSGSFEYGPFGELIRASGGAVNVCAFRFSTKYQDSESDFNYYGHRYYGPSTGLWLSRDRSEEAGGLNLHGFNFNNPQAWIDPDGEAPNFVNGVTYTYDPRTGSVTPATGSLRPSPATLSQRRQWTALVNGSPLATKLLNNYMDASGASVTLTEGEMAAVRPLINLKVVPRFQSKVDQLTSDNSRIVLGEFYFLARATEPYTLGRFYVAAQGELCGSSPQRWTFTGIMRFDDVYDFDPQPYAWPPPPGELSRSPLAEYYVRVAK